MSFKLGTFDTTSIPDFKVILTEWPMLPTEITLDELPAGDGALYYKSRMGSTEWVFNLELTGTDIADVLAKADQVSMALNPLLHGQRDFTPNAMDPWVWQGILSGPITWKRDKVLWFSDQGISRLSGVATITTPNPYGYQLGAAETLQAPGGMTLVGQGNTNYYPTVEFRGVLSSAQRFIVGGTEVAGPLVAGQTMVLDFESLDFYIMTTATGAKVRNIADRFTTFTRLMGIDTVTIPVSVSAGTFTQAVGRVPSRRI